MKKLIIVLLSLSALSTASEAVSRRGVQRQNILQLIYPNGVPSAPAPTPPVVTTPTEPPAPTNIPTPIEGGSAVVPVTP